MSISERVELLAEYTNTPKVLTVSAISTNLELELVSNEDYDATMLDTILPKVVKESVDFHSLLEIDYQWLCRCIRFLSYGPEVTVRSIICDDCGKYHKGEYKADLRVVSCAPLPNNFHNTFTIHPQEFLDTDIGYVTFHLPTVDEGIQIRTACDQYLNNPVLSKMCVMIDSIGDSRLTEDPKENMDLIFHKFNSADYQILVSLVTQMSDFGLRSYGDIQCPVCRSSHARFFALPNDLYFTRPWELDSEESVVDVNGQLKTYQQVRQKLYESIVDETLFIARASEGAVSAEWVMSQPVFIRKKYVESFSKELKEREAKLNKQNTKH